MDLEQFGRDILKSRILHELSDHLWRRYMELMLIARLNNKNGLIPDVHELAWYLRDSTTSIDKDIIDLYKKTLLIKRGDVYYHPTLHFRLTGEKEGVHVQQRTIHKKKANCGIYVLYSKELNLYKIGMSNELDKRTGRLATLFPGHIRCIVKIYTHNYKSLEKDLHSRFEDKRDKGEWFKLDDDDIEYIKSLRGDNGER